MRLLLCSLLLLVLSPFLAFGQVPSYPDSLTKKANEIIISDDTEFFVESIQKSKLKRSYQAVILNSKAKEANKVVLYYSKFRKVKYAKVSTQNMSGKQRESWSLRDFDDYSTKGYSLASDSRAKYLEVLDNNYPYIINVEYEIDFSGSLFYPTWTPQAEKQAVVSASLTIASKEPNMFRYQSSNITPVSEIISPGQKVIWQVNNLSAYEYEYYSYQQKDYAPLVYSAPNRFQMDGVEGNLSSWEDFGKWISTLNQDRNDLTAEQLAEVRKLIPEGASVIEKVRIAYDYLQQNSRYVSIQLGLGGWQPFHASFVHEKKYGDCKALSFYTQSLLASLDVPSFYTLINAGSSASKTDENFPMSKFNHAILTVPTEKDTVWLECTSQTNPFGYLGAFTSDRKALMITPEGGKVIHTRSYKADENLQTTSVQIDVDDKGVGHAQVQRQYRGMEIENDDFDGANRLSEDERQKWFVDEHDWGQLELESLEVTAPTEGVIPVGEMNAEVKIRNAASSSSNRLFFKPFVFTNISWFNVKRSSRSAPLEIRYPFTQADTIQVAFPEQFFMESGNFDKKLESEFGSYEVTMTNDEGKLTFIRKCVINKGVYEPEMYDEFRTFIRGIQKSDNKKLVMLNKT